MLSKELQKVSEVVAKMDCGDSSCRFAKSRRGMRTNGGCTCFDRPNCRLAMIAVIDALPALLQAARERDAIKYAYERADEEVVAMKIERDEAVRLLAKLYHDYNSTFTVGAWDEHLRKFVMSDVGAFLARVSR